MPCGRRKSIGQFCGGGRHETLIVLTVHPRYKEKKTWEQKTEAMGFTRDASGAWEQDLKILQRSRDNMPNPAATTFDKDAQEKQAHSRGSSGFTAIMVLLSELGHQVSPQELLLAREKIDEFIHGHEGASKMITSASPTPADLPITERRVTTESQEIHETGSKKRKRNSDCGLVEKGNNELFYAAAEKMVDDNWNTCTPNPSGEGLLRQTCDATMQVESTFQLANQPTRTAGSSDTAHGQTETLQDSETRAPETRPVEGPIVGNPIVHRPAIEKAAIARPLIERQQIERRPFERRPIERRLTGISQPPTPETERLQIQRAQTERPQTNRPAVQTQAIKQPIRIPPSKRRSTSIDPDKEVKREKDFKKPLRTGFFDNIKW